MVGRGELTDAAWGRLAPQLPKNGRRGKQWRDHRTVINAILWKLRTGAPWRDLPERYGPWRTATAPTGWPFQALVSTPTTRSTGPAYDAARPPCLHDLAVQVSEMERMSASRHTLLRGVAVVVLLLAATWLADDAHARG